MCAEKVKPLTKKQLETLRKKIEDEKKGLVFSNDLDAKDFGLEAEGASDELDQAIADYNSSHLLRFRNREVFYFKKLAKALQSFDRGDYGNCVECGGPIKYERLLARPTAEMCIICKEEAERDESNSIHGKQSKSFVKTVEFTGAR